MKCDPVRSLAVEPPESYANALRMTSLTREKVQSRCLTLLIIYLATNCDISFAKQRSGTV